MDSLANPFIKLLSQKVLAERSLLVEWSGVLDECSDFKKATPNFRQKSGFV